jgi:hypothetical protein
MIRPTVGLLRTRAMLVCMVVLVSTLLGADSAFANPDDYWDARFFANGTNVNGLVSAVAVGGGYVYVGGQFSSMFGVPANNIARFDGTTWSAMGTGIGGGVNALAVSGGNLYVGGSFGTAGGGSASNIAKWNGSAWSALGLGVDSVVHAIAVSGSTVYVGGEFGNAGGSSASRIAQWNGASWSPIGAGMNNNVWALAVSGSNLYAGGQFTSPATRIAQWDGTAWTGLGTGTDNTVMSIVVDGANLDVGGWFTSAGGVGANRVARWNGTTWSAFGGGMNATVDGLALLGSDLYAVGEFTTPGNHVAKWNGSTWVALGSGIGQINPGAAIAASATHVYVGAQFIGAGGMAAYGVARYDGSAWSLATTVPGAGVIGAPFYPAVHAVAKAPSGDLYATGVFEFAGATPAISVARFDGTSWNALGTGLEGTNLSNFFHGVGDALAFYGGDLVVGGNFSNAGGVGANNIARWNGSSWFPLGLGVGGGQIEVKALAEYNGELYAAGSFTSADGNAVAHIARWNGTSWSGVGGGTNGTVNALIVVGSNLYVAGGFSSPASNVARWDGSSWSAVGSGVNNGVLALAAVGTDLYAGGSFFDGSAIEHWDGSTWAPPSGGGICTFCGFGGHNVTALASIGNDLYVGGNFDHVGTASIAANGIARWNGVTWSPLGSGVNGAPGGFAVDGADLWVGGGHQFAGGHPSSFVTLWHNCGNGVVDQGEQCDDGNTTNGDCCSSTCQYEANGSSCPDDGNPCTNDQCNATGGCAHPNNTASCDDGLFCDGVDVCSGGVCTHAGDPCPGPDGDGNCAESCDEATDSCTAPDPNGSACDDGDGCTIGDTCSGGTCQPGGPKDCSDSNVCTTDTCSSPSGTCVHTNNTLPCDDGLFCDGADTCVGGVCQHAGDPCAGGPECANVCNEAADNCLAPPTTQCTPDPNVCTDDHCNGAGACVHTNNTAPCDDGLFCNGSDTCSGGTCTHAGNPCAGGPECANLCDETANDCFNPSGTSCTDDGNVCTLDQCNGAGACTHPAGNEGGACGDASACTSSGTCSGGACTGATTTCLPCQICTAATCVDGPKPTGCKGMTKPLKATLFLQDRSPDDLDQVKWKWSSGEATSFQDLGDPLHADAYALCVYDASSQLLMRMVAPAGGTCGTKPCWKMIGSAIVPKGYKYKDFDGLPNDLDGLVLKAGADGKAKMTLKGKGVNVPMPALSTLALPLTTQLQSGNGQCYEATFSSSGVTVDTSTLFKAKGN